MFGCASWRIAAVRAIRFGRQLDGLVSPPLGSVGYLVVLLAAGLGASPSAICTSRPCAPTACWPVCFLWFGFYSSVLAPPVFGLPDGVDLTPNSMLQYTVSYGAGWIDAKKDGKAGRLNLEAFGFGTITPGAPHFSEAALKQYQIEVTHVAGCVVNTRIIGHARGYNDTMIEEIKRRCGTAVVKAAQDEDARWLQSYADGVEAGRWTPGVIYKQTPRHRSVRSNKKRRRRFRKDAA